MAKEYALTESGARAIEVLQQTPHTTTTIDSAIRGDILREMAGSRKASGEMDITSAFSITDEEVNEEYGTAGLRVLRALEEEGVIVSQEA